MVPNQLLHFSDSSIKFCCHLREISNFIGAVWFVFECAIILEGGKGVETRNLPILLVFMCCMTGINDKEF